MNNLLVTGGCGFIGANFIRYIFEESDFRGKLVNLDRLTYAGNPESIADVAGRFPERYAFEQIDICDVEALAKVIEDHKIDTICHFAAESHVDRSIVMPDAFIKTNIIGTFNLLEICRRLPEQIKLFHHVSTDEVYGSLGSEGYFTESTAYDPSSPYSASKAGSDHLVRAYHRTYGIPVTISNCSNNYGPYQFPEKLIPLMILNALEGKALPVYGDGKNVRDWLYVKDHCRAIHLIMQKGRRGATYNVGGDNEMQNLSVVEEICDLVDRIAGKAGGIERRSLITFVKDRPGHDWRYAIDFSLLKDELGWQPSESFQSGLEKTVRWYIDNPRWVQRVRSGEYQQWMKSHYE